RSREPADPLSLLLGSHATECTALLEDAGEVTDVLRELTGIDRVGSGSHSRDADLYGHRAHCARVVTGDHLQGDALLGEISHGVRGVVAHSLGEHHEGGGTQVLR